MAVEARHINLFTSQLLTDREIRPNLLNPDVYNPQMDSALLLPSTMTDSLLSFYPSPIRDPTSAKTSFNKADCRLNYHIPVPRKRSRDLISELNVLPVPQNKLSSGSSFLDQDILCQIQNQQYEIDHSIAEHTEKVRMGLEKQRMRQSRMLRSAIQEAMVKRLKEKDEEIQRMGKLNWVLLERVKSLCVENQILRELAQTNEATANSLRRNLAQVLAQVSEDCHTAGGLAVVDAGSSCGSNEEEFTAEPGEDTEATGGKVVACGGNGSYRMLCKKCGVSESIVLLLPCRHLCICTMCGSTVHTCPVCYSGINASVHVNFS